MNVTTHDITIGDTATRDTATRGTRAVAIDPAARRTAATRQAIVDAVVVALEEEHPASLVMEDIARRAGVTVRTVYRYFPTKQELLDDVAEIQRRKVEAMSGSARALYEDHDAWLPALWRTFSDDIQSVRAQHRAQVGGELRASRLNESRRGVRITLGTEHPDLTDAELDRLVDGVIAVTSSSMFLELVDRMGWDVRDAAQMSLWMVDALRANASPGTPHQTPQEQKR